MSCAVLFLLSVKVSIIIPQKGDKKDQQQAKPDDKISKKEAEQMLNAVQNQEKEVKEKVDKKKAVLRPVRSEKDW